MGLVSFAAIVALFVVLPARKWQRLLGIGLMGILLGHVVDLSLQVGRQSPWIASVDTAIEGCRDFEDVRAELDFEVSGYHVYLYSSGDEGKRNGKGFYSLPKKERNFTGLGVVVTFLWASVCFGLKSLWERLATGRDAAAESAGA